MAELPTDDELLSGSKSSQGAVSSPTALANQSSVSSNQSFDAEVESAPTSDPPKSPNEITDSSDDEIEPAVGDSPKKESKDCEINLSPPRRTKFRKRSLKSQESSTDDAVHSSSGCKDNSQNNDEVHCEEVPGQIEVLSDSDNEESKHKGHASVAVKGVTEEESSDSP